MSKKHRYNFQSGNTASVSPASSHAAEYRIIRNDLIRVVVLNAIFLAGVLAIYFTDRQAHYLERIYSQLF